MNLTGTLKSLDLRKLTAGTCPKHPNADVRHSWDETHAVELKLTQRRQDRGGAALS